MHRKEHSFMRPLREVIFCIVLSLIIIVIISNILKSFGIKGLLVDIIITSLIVIVVVILMLIYDESRNKKKIEDA